MSFDFGVWGVGLVVLFCFRCQVLGFGFHVSSFIVWVFRVKGRGRDAGLGVGAGCLRRRPHTVGDV